jgi:Spy/CpxP family protein refolding chaperone
MYEVRNVHDQQETRKMKTRTLTLLILALTTAASLACARPGGRDAGAPGPGDGPGRFPALCERLGLSEDQQAAIDKIREESREAGTDTRKQIVRLRNDLEGLMLEDEPDAGEVEKLVRRIGELRTEQQVRRLQTRLAIRAQLTDEQRDRLIALRGARGHGHGDRGFDRGCRGPARDGRGPGRRSGGPHSDRF